jgi:hypothetical protein
MKGLRIDYTIYSPDYAPGAGECLDYPTFRGAKRKAKALGAGSLVIRNFNREKVNGVVNIWWQSPYCWVWNGLVFQKTRSAQEGEWTVERSVWSRGALFQRFRSSRP